MNRLPATFHQDPADRLIVATARAGRLPLATHDARIRRSRQTSLWVALGHDVRGGLTHGRTTFTGLAAQCPWVPALHG